MACLPEHEDAVVEVYFDHQRIGEFGTSAAVFQQEEERLQQELRVSRVASCLSSLPRGLVLSIGSVEDGQHTIAARLKGREGGGSSEVKIHVGEGSLSILVGDEREEEQNVVRLNAWGYPTISPRNPLHVYVNGRHYRTDDAFIVIPVQPGTCHIRVAITDAFGDIVMESNANVTVLPPPPARQTSVLDLLAAASDGDVLISCLHPTRGRPEDAIAVRSHWLALARHPMRVEWVFAVDSDDVEALEGLVSTFRDEENTRVVCVPIDCLFYPEGFVRSSCSTLAELAAGTCVAGWNFAALAARGHVLLSVADDFFPPAGWDELVMSRTPLFDPAVLMTGFVLFPEFKSVYCDDDFTLSAKLDGVEVDGLDIAFEHRHSVHGTTSPSATITVR
ncbi:hypothetical protein GUITHDRAFT_118890 [Guillardia theta CCMP2712]|uniref:Uncharacterized protein n=1 Tax=Guillardia theta (strain CCMP2712) TaxID=905079 RepID=L1IGA6_GUITC|nr:hypothetical protein GUITHDRAFT_118890 [Guillardia theta CCMP2712]EKX34959.1 hypothetical protein GUITHDRAFT_118890 [Guillardia theta CCMP2712]|eukprot:XP_005821939.1 hypothetical protein GUITHDRAFT_118890 [Guillardia theta CCMP2712]